MIRNPVSEHVAHLPVQLDYMGRPVIPGLPVTREEHARNAEWIAARFDARYREALAQRDAMAYARPPQSKREARANCDACDALSYEIARAISSRNLFEDTAARIRVGE